MLSPIGRVLIAGASAVVIVAGMRASSSFLGPILFALLITVAAQPIIHWLERHRLRTWAAVLFVTLGGVIIGVALIAFVSTSLTQLGGNLPVYEAHFSMRLASLSAWLAGYGLQVPLSLSASGLFDAAHIFNVLGRLLEILAGGITSGLLTLLLFVVFAIESPRTTALVRAKVGRESAAEERFITLGQSITGYFRVRALNNLFMAVSLGLILWALRIDYAGLWGVLVFFLSFIPSIGLPLAMAPAVLLAWVEHGPLGALLVVIAALVIDVLGDDVLTPRLAGQALNMSIPTIFLSFIFWAWVFGALGALISVPLTAIVMVALDSYDETRWVANLMSARGVTPLS